MTNALSPNLRATSRPSRVHSEHSDSQPCQWDGLIPFRYSMMTSRTSSDPRYLMSPFPISTMFRLKAPQHDISFRTANARLFPKTWEFGDLYGNISRVWIALFSA